MTKKVPLRRRTFCNSTARSSFGIALECKVRRMHLCTNGCLPQEVSRHIPRSRPRSEHTVLYQRRREDRNPDHSDPGID